MRHRIGEKVIGPATSARPRQPSNRHHHHLQRILQLPNRSVMKACSTFYSSTIIELGIRLKLGVVVERNNVKVAVIQKEKLSSKNS